MPDHAQIVENAKLSYSVREAQTATGLGETNLRKLIKSGRIKALRIGTKFIIPRGELERWLREEARGPAWE